MRPWFVGVIRVYSLGRVIFITRGSSKIPRKWLADAEWSSVIWSPHLPSRTLHCYYLLFSIHIDFFITWHCGRANSYKSRWEYFQCYYLIEDTQCKNVQRPKFIKPLNSIVPTNNCTKEKGRSKDFVSDIYSSAWWAVSMATEVQSKLILDVPHVQNECEQGFIQGFAKAMRP